MQKSYRSSASSLESYQAMLPLDIHRDQKVQSNTHFRVLINSLRGLAVVGFVAFVTEDVFVVSVLVDPEVFNNASVYSE